MASVPTDPSRPVSGETYFFRDHGQFDLLRLRLLPELIARGERTRTLRIWSAGCSSGEEPYSLAMLVDMLLPARVGWNILVLGSDIDPTALAGARQGRYRPWSFRMFPPELLQRYFRRQGDEWLLDERIRRMVSFRSGDLIGEEFPGGELHDMDLILCRNVFIYFDAGTVAAVSAKLAACLSEGGYLMTGHTELIGHRVGCLRGRLFAEGVVYQRVSPTIAEAAPPPIGGASSSRVVPPAPAPHSVPRVTQVPSLAELLAQAHACADRGDYARAESLCRQASVVAPLAAEPYFLLAQLAQLRSDFTLAGQLLDKTLYLDPRNVAATLELAALSERTDNLSRAKILRRGALDIVRDLPGDAVIEPYETTAAELARWLAQ